MEALVDYESGDWDALPRARRAPGEAPPPIPEAMLLGVRSMVLVGAG